MSALPEPVEFVDPLEEHFMVGGLGHQNKGHARCFEHIDKGLFGVEAVGGNGYFKFRVRATDVGNNALGRIDLAILLGGAVGIGHGLRGQGQHLAHMGIYHHGLQNLVRVTGGAFSPFAGQALGAVNLVGRKILGAVQGNQIVAAFQLVGLQLPAPLQPLQQQGKHRMKRGGGHLIEGFSQGAVGGNVGYGKHGFKVTILQVLLHASLKGEYGRVLKKHHGQGTHQAVVEAIVDFTGLPGIVDLLEAF